MKEFENNAYFWQKIDTLFLSHKLEITREKGDRHPEYANLIYPTKYGRLVDTALDVNGDGISVFKGSAGNSVNAIIVCADILKKDLETKLVVGCNEEEEELILQFLNQTDFQKSVIIRRGMEIPSWGITD